jgi:uncharacterized protein
MPKRSLNSRVLRWPDAETVISAAQGWATAVAQGRSDVVGIGYIGSYARGDWGVGSDLDVVVVLDRADEPFHERNLKFESPQLPVPVDLLVYTSSEIEAFKNERRRFGTVLEHELNWLYQRHS